MPPFNPSTRRYVSSKALFVYLWSGESLDCEPETVGLPVAASGVISILAKNSLPLSGDLELLLPFPPLPLPGDLELELPFPPFPFPGDFELLLPLPSEHRIEPPFEDFSDFELFPDFDLRFLEDFEDLEDLRDLDFDDLDEKDRVSLEISEVGVSDGKDVGEQDGKSDGSPVGMEVGTVVGPVLIEGAFVISCALAMTLIQV